MDATNAARLGFQLGAQKDSAHCGNRIARSFAVHHGMIGRIELNFALIKIMDIEMVCLLTAENPGLYDLARN